MENFELHVFYWREVWLRCVWQNVRGALLLCAKIQIYKVCFAIGISNSSKNFRYMFNVTLETSAINNNIVEIYNTYNTVFVRNTARTIIHHSLKCSRWIFLSKRNSSKCPFSVENMVLWILSLCISIKSTPEAKSVVETYWNESKYQNKSLIVVSQNHLQSND